MAVSPNHNEEEEMNAAMEEEGPTMEEDGIVDAHGQQQQPPSPPPPPPPPPVPEGHRRGHRPYRREGSTATGGWRWILCSMRGTSPVHLMEKVLQETDVSRHHTRLLIPVLKEQPILAFMTNGERRSVSPDAAAGVAAVGRETPFVPVRVIDGAGRSYGMKLSRWSNKSIHLKGRWMSFVRRNMVERGDVLQVWGFRREVRDPRVDGLPEEEEEEEEEKGMLCMVLRVTKERKEGDPPESMRDLEKLPSWHVKLT